jgi:uncharacterized repeat protein (TIGR01451 family)
MTATVTPAVAGAQPPSGTVTFTENGNTIATATLFPNGTFSVAPGSAAFTVGTHTVTASYPGDSNFAPSSGVATLTVNTNSTTTLILASPNPSTTGQPVTFNVVISPVTPTVSTFVPTGTVSIFDNGMLIGTPTLSSIGGNSSAVLTISTLTVGSHTITSNYAGDSNFNGSTGTITQVVNPPVAIDTSVTVAATPTSSTIGQSVTFTATITAASGTVSPIGTVTFSDGITTLGSAPAGASGSGQSTATLTTTALPVGSLTITASYSGDSTFNPSTGSTPFTVQKQGAGTAISSSVGNMTTVGQSVTFTATVNAAAGALPGPPTGTVTFTVNGTPVATPTLDNNGQATFTTSSLPVGSDTVVATYNGDNNFAGGSGGSIVVTVNPVPTAPPSITKIFGATSINIGQFTTLSFTITNPNASPTSLTGVSFTDTFPSGLIVATPNGLTGSCGGGAITATAAGTSVVLTGATLAASANCTFSVNVTATSAGAKNNVTSPVTSNEGGTGNTANASIGVNAPSPPQINKAFGATSINIGQSTSLSFTITNPNASSSLTGVGFSDPLPPGLVVATPSIVTGSCGGGSIAAAAAGTSVSLSGATLAANASCTFSVNITASTSGAKNNVTGAVTSNEGGAGNTANASITVNAPSPPSISKAFGATSINVGQNTSLSFTIKNPNASSSLTGVGFTDAFPSGLVVATPNGLTGSCGGGSITAAAAGTSVSLSGATLAANASCTFSVNVTASTSGARPTSLGPSLPTRAAPATLRTPRSP